MFAAGVGCADLLAKPVVVHLVDFVDQDESWFGIVVSRAHDDVPQAACGHGFAYFAGNHAVFVKDVAVYVGQVAPDDLFAVGQIQVVEFDFFFGDRKRQRPRLVVFDRFDELGSYQQRQVKLAQSSVFAFGADKFDDIGMADIERRHLRAASAACGRYGKTHLVVDVHERQRA